MKKRSEQRKMERYSDCYANRGQHIPQSCGFFQLRHETMLHGSLGAVARGRPAASIVETVAPI
jgi:hypothetical protein